jgi:exodeoxyribonuclease-5
VNPAQTQLFSTPQTPPIQAAPDASEKVLSPGQESALQTLCKSYSRELTMAGPAGTGKTTIVHELIKRLEAERGYVFQLLAPTAKAALVLSEKTGRSAHTIHSQLFRKSAVINGQLTFGAPQTLGGPDTMIVVDEASMVPETLYETIMKYLHSQARILFVGDPCQLQPVGGKLGPKLKRPTVILTEIHRQAESSSIIQIATAIRQGKKFGRLFRPPETELTTVSPAEWYWSQPANQSRAVLTYTHADRRNIINAIRRHPGNLTDWLHRGEQIVCTKNNAAAGIVNGDIITITSVMPMPEFEFSCGPGGAKRIADFHAITCAEYPESLFIISASNPSLSFNENARDNGIMDAIVDKIKAAAKRKNSSMTDDERRLTRVIPWQFAYCLTVHTSQGSQWDNVFFFHTRKQVAGAQYSMGTESPANGIQPLQELYYTAVTRAAKTLTMNEI